MRLEHNHVEFSNNVWSYVVERSRWMGNLAGGLEMDLPFVSKRFDWRYEKGLDHALLFRNNDFSNNKHFQFRISGYYAQTTIQRNTFSENQCRRGLILLEGMEKQLNVLNNSMLRNSQCRYMLQLDMYSQTEQARLVPGFGARQQHAAERLSLGYSLGDQVHPRMLHCWCVWRAECDCAPQPTSWRRHGRI